MYFLQRIVFFLPLLCSAGLNVFYHRRDRLFDKAICLLMLKGGTGIEAFRWEEPQALLLEIQSTVL